MLVFGDGRIVGTIGGGCYENDAFGKAREAIPAGAAARPLRARRRLRAGDRPHLRRQMDVYIEPIEPSPELYVVGAGHVGFHLARIAQESASASTSSTIARSSRTPSAFPRRGDRRRRHPGVDRARTSAARLRRHRHARPYQRSRGAARAGAARAALPRSDRQPRQGRAHLRRAADGQHAAELLARVHAPIGLDIGAVTPQEIAVSILAELIAVKHGKDHAALDAVDPALARKSEVRTV
jgi:xanthine dehydrogenase accessory factor